MRSCLILFVSVTIASLLSGCSSISDSNASSGGGGSLHPIIVTVSGAPATVNAGDPPIPITATVDNDPAGRGVKWFLQVPSNATGVANRDCAPTCGTLTSITPSSVTYTPPPTVPGSRLIPPATQPTDFSSPILVAIAVDDNGKVVSNNFKIQGTPAQVLSLQIDNPPQTAFTGGNALDLSVTLTNDVNNLGVTWLLVSGSPDPNKPTCASSLLNPFTGCGSLLNATPFNAVYVGPGFPLPPASVFTPVVIAIANADVTKFTSVTFPVQQATTQNALSGHYAFQLRGFDPNGNPTAIVGGMTTNGFGKISTVSIDVNDNQTVAPGISNGQYYIDSALRGNFQLQYSNASANLVQPNFSYTLSADGTHGTVIGFDKNVGLMSGTIQKQDPTSFTPHGINNDYIFKLESNLPDRYDAVGHMSINLDTRIHVFMDTARVNLGLGLVNADFVGSLDSFPDANGRGTMTLAAAHFVYYVVSSDTIYLQQTDDSKSASNALWSGIIKFQKIQSFTSSTPNATSVFDLTGLNNSGGPISAIGTLTIANNTSASLLWDTNDSGTILSQMSATGQTVTFDPRSGRGTITISNGRNNGLFDSAVFYLADSGDGFWLDSTSGTSNRAMVGDLSPQVGAGSFGGSSLSGNILALSGGSSKLNIPNMSGLIAAASGDFTGLADSTSTISSKAPFKVLLSPTQPFTGSSSLIDPLTGRGVAVVPGFLFGSTDTEVTSVIYVVAPNQFVLISSQAGVQSGVSSFIPH